MRFLPYLFIPLLVALGTTLQSCEDKGLEVTVEVWPADEEEPVPMLIEKSCQLEVLDVTTQLLAQKEDLEFGARANNNTVQVGAMWRGNAAVEIRPYGESFTLAGYKFTFDGYRLTVDGEDLGTVTPSDRLRVSSGGVDVERG